MLGASRARELAYGGLREGAIPAAGRGEPRGRRLLFVNTSAATALRQFRFSWTLVVLAAIAALLGAILTADRLSASVSAYGWQDASVLHGPRPQVVRVADVNGDGIPDVLVGNSDSLILPTIGVQLYLGLPGGGLADAPIVTAPIVNRIRDLAVVDLDGDPTSPPDVIALSQSSVIVLSWDGTRLFERQRRAVSPFLGFTAIVIGDSNLDGYDDVLVRGRFGTMTVCRNDPTDPDPLGGLAAFCGASSPVSGIHAFEDIDGDDDDDIVQVRFFTLPDAREVRVLYFDSGAWGSPISVMFEEVNSGDVIPVVADFTGDGAPDIATMVRHGTLGTRFDEVFFAENLDTAVPSFGPETSIFTGQYEGLLAGQFSGDTIADLVAYGHAAVEVYEADGAGGFSFAHTSLLRGVDGRGGALADVTGDGTNDLLMPGDDFGRVTLLRGTTTPAMTFSLEPKHAANAHPDFGQRPLERIFYHLLNLPSGAGITWSVDGDPGGNAVVGTVFNFASSSGIYRAPGTPPPGGSVEVAVSGHGLSASLTFEVTELA